MINVNNINLNQEIVYRIEKEEVGRYYNIGDRVHIPKLRNTTQYKESKNNIEELFETVRQKSFPYLPSRMAARFVLPYNLKTVSKWVDEHYIKRRENVFLLTMQLTGKIVWCDESIYNEAILPLKTSEREHLAFKYWETAGALNEDFKLPEGLFFEGSAIIKDIQQFDTDQLKAINPK